MYNQDPKRKRRQLKVRYFTYGVMTFATMAITTLGFFFLLGYRFDSSSQTFVQGSLIKFDSLPQSARVLVDGVDIGRTAMQDNILAGQHSLRYTRSGYQDWFKDFSVNPGQLLWFDYAKLIPKDITTTISHTFPSYEANSTAPTHEWMLVREQSLGSSFTLIDVRNEQKPVYSTITLPDAITRKDDQGGTGSFAVVSWSYNAKRALLAQQVSGQTFYYVMPIEQPERTVILEQGTQAPQFASSQDDILYAQNTAGMTVKFAINNDSATITQVFDTKYAAAKPYSDSKIAVVSHTDDAKQQLTIIHNGKITLIDEAGAAASLKPLFYDVYRGSEYLAYSTGNRLVVVRDPSDVTERKQVYNETLTFEPTHALISPANHFLLVTSGIDGFVVNLERSEKHMISLQSAEPSATHWLDEYHLGMSDGPTASIADYDGTNVQRIVSINPASAFLLGKDLKVLLSIGKNNVTGAIELQTSSLVTK